MKQRHCLRRAFVTWIITGMTRRRTIQMMGPVPGTLTRTELNARCPFPRRDEQNIKLNFTFVSYSWTGSSGFIPQWRSQTSETFVQRRNQCYVRDNRWLNCYILIKLKTNLWYRQFHVRTLGHEFRVNFGHEIITVFSYRKMKIPTLKRLTSRFCCLKRTMNVMQFQPMTIQVIRIFFTNT